MSALPRNVEEARAVLLELGSLSPERLLAALEPRLGFRPPARLVDTLLDRYSELFQLVEGRLALRVDAGEADEEVDMSAESWWQSIAAPPPVDLQRAVVLSVSTSGLDPEVHELRTVCIRRLDGAVVLDGGPADVATVAEVLAAASAVIGHRPRQLALPFLETAAGRRLPLGGPVLDVHELSVLVEPGLPGRSLEELAAEYGVARPAPDDASEAGRSIAELFRILVDRYDPTEPSWNLAWRTLVAGGSGWPAVLAEPGPLPELSQVLVPAPDPLAAPVANARARTAHQSQYEGLRRLAEQPYFRERPGQHRMAGSVAAALDNGRRLLVEAPTGTGKSIAYLLPAIGRAAREPVVVATKTKVLQRQLQRDARELRELGILTVPFRRIQGIDNYLCTREIAETIEAGDLEGREWAALAVAVRALATSDTGLWDDVTDRLLQRDDLEYKRRRLSLRATNATCDRQRCDHVARCPLFSRLERVTDQPGIIVANHALLAAWAGDGQDPEDDDRTKLVPFVRTDRAHLIIDEAHDLEDTLTSAWTQETGATDIAVLVASLLGRHGPLRRIARERGVQPGELRKPLREVLALLDQSRVDVGRAAAHYLREYARGGETALLPGNTRSRPEFRSLAAASRNLALGLVRLREQLRELMPTAAADALTRAWTPAERQLSGTIDDLTARIDLLFALPGLPETHLFVHVLAIEDPGDEGPPVEERWLFRRIPIEVGRRFSATILERATSTVLTSATLRVDGAFDFVAQRLGLSLNGAEEDTDPEAFATEVVASPFNHDEQSAVILTSHLALPVPGSERQFCDDLADDQVGFLSLAGGKTLSLFAARSRMQAVAERVRQYETPLADRGVSLLVQGEDAPATIERRFREDPGTVVYGLRSYWEGFDAPGETLSYLMIEKPPYPHPDDVVVAARRDNIQARGGDPFMEYVVPRTAIVLTQGFGRLVRTEDDRGAAIVADRRLQLPTPSNTTLLRTLPTSNLIFTTTREDAWREAIRFVTGEEPDLSQAILVGAADIDRLLEELRIRPGDDVEAKLRRAARELFDVDELRDEQVQLMLAILAGRDVLGFLPTGFGKSLCFQLPALLQPEARATVVVSPLIALIKDQVDDLRSRRRLREVVGITGRTSRAEQIEILRDLATGKVRLLYLSPERLVRDPTLHTALRQVDLNGLVVDEAHCISSWGHDFRPEFRQIAKSVLALRRSPRLGFTATATEHVEQDIERTLEMTDPLVVRRTVDRPDLSFRVLKFSKDLDRLREMFRFVLAQGDAPGVVYASRRALTEELAWYLRQLGVTARSYHAGMLPEQREVAQDDFLNGTTQVIVATKAFGMGVNKPDIHWVLHFDTPESLEGYAQEAGRAARAPELTGECALFFTERDIKIREHQVASWDADDQFTVASKLLEVIRKAPLRGVDHLVDPEWLAEELERDEDELNVLVAWLEQIGCLERKLDAAVRGHVTIGYQEPRDPEEKRRFWNLLRRDLACRIGVRRFVDLDAVAAEVGTDADGLAHQLTDWSLQRLVTFVVTQRRWRLQVLSDRPDRASLHRLVRDWERLQRDRLWAMISYARGSTCRRVLIVEQFGDPPQTCTESGGLPCDVCSGTEPPWHRIPMDRVPHPDDIVDVPLIALQAVRWASDRRGTYGEKGLCAAICGKERIGEHPIAPALLWCPQFGALRYLKANERRLHEAIEKLVADDFVRRERTTHNGRSYDTLVITERGRMRLGGVGG